MNNVDRKIIVITKGMDGSDGTSRVIIRSPYGRANSFDVMAHQRDFVDDIINALLKANSVYSLGRMIREVVNK